MFMEEASNDALMTSAETLSVLRKCRIVVNTPSKSQGRELMFVGMEPNVCRTLLDSSRRKTDSSGALRKCLMVVTEY